jgi:uncharacterized protein YgbK (DUF1537 family)
MIAVIADDLTGAAELGGIGLRYHLNVEIGTRVDPLTRADLLIIATDTRSKELGAALQDMREILVILDYMAPELVYKKVDSVLRGHILAEIQQQMELSGQKRALLVPANPSMGRVISDGIYYLNGRMLHETGFRTAPGYSITSSRVTDILEKQPLPKAILAKPGDPLPETGIIVGEASQRADLRYWLERADRECLLAGAAEFFQELLAFKGLPAGENNPQGQLPKWGTKMLLVCGSAFSASRQAVADALTAGAPVAMMPAALSGAPEDEADFVWERWAAEALAMFEKHDRVIISPGVVGQYPDRMLAKRVSRHIAETVRRITLETPVEELMLEGGATASAVLRELGVERCSPMQEVAHGVIRMELPDRPGLHITLKPGSYPWPSSIWNFGKSIA